eukprot:4172681-Amphidinium_carterae.1
MQHGFLPAQNVSHIQEQWHLRASHSNHVLASMTPCARSLSRDCALHSATRRLCSVSGTA